MIYTNIISFKVFAKVSELLNFRRKIFLGNETSVLPILLPYKTTHLCCKLGKGILRARL